MLPLHSWIKSKSGKSQMNATQLSFVPGAWGDLIE